MRFSLGAIAAVAFSIACGAAYGELPLPADRDAAASVPMTVLSPEDAALYRQAFAAARAGQTSTVNDLLAKITDQSLKGYVLAETYLSPAGSAPLADLIDWMHNYAELPIADRVYRLAVAKASKKVRKHHRVVAVVMTASVPVPVPPAPHRRPGGYEEFDPSEQPMTSDAGRSARAQIETCIKADQPDQAAAIMRQAIANGVPDYDRAKLAQRVAASYLAEGEDQAAYDTAMSVTGAIRKAVPTLDWYAGFAAYRMGKYDDAARQLEQLAVAASMPNYVRSQAAFWAARAHLRDGDPQRVVTLLEAAAREQPTFYGVLAEQMLGKDTATGFHDPVLTAADFAAIMQVSPAHRAVALMQLGEERSSLLPEFNRAFGDGDAGHVEGFAAIARRIGDPNTEMRASEVAAGRGVLLTGLYPVPPYRPEGGYSVDPALMLAFVRAESRFQPEVVSSAGARGLMQLMPATATRYGGSGALSSLDDPSYNMTLGQRYLAYLLDNYNGNLVQVPAAYNAGPGRLVQWINARAGKEDDPLCFIESIRITETRLYVKRVLMYHWMYGRRLGQGAPSLEQAASGTWPTYRNPATAPRPVLATPVSVPAAAPAAAVTPVPAKPVEPVPSTKPTVVSDARY